MSGFMGAFAQLDGQTLAAALIGLAAVLHLARRWWPRKASTPASGCGSCDQGCAAAHSPCPSSALQPLQEHPIQLKTRN